MEFSQLKQDQAFLFVSAVKRFLENARDITPVTVFIKTGDHRAKNQATGEELAMSPTHDVLPLK